jgi:hypothetical protein
LRVKIAIVEQLGDVLLALPIIYVLSYLLPNPKIFDIPGKLMAVSKSRKKPAVIPKAILIDIKAYTEMRSGKTRQLLVDHSVGD